MSSRGSRKRPALSEASPMNSNLMQQLERSYEPPTRRSRRDILSCELETIQAELEHERSLRALDSKRFVQAKKRLEKQVEFAAEEVKESKSLINELRDEHERHLEQLRRALTRTKAEVRQARVDFDDERALVSRKILEDDPRLRKLEEDLEAKAIENDQLQETIVELRKDLKKFIEEQKQNNSAQLVQVQSGENNMPEARSQGLKELNRVRVHLAESERKNRQYKRIAEEAQRKVQELVQEREKLRSTNKYIEQLEVELKESKSATESAAEKLRKWQDLGSAIASTLGPASGKKGPSAASNLSVLKQYLNDTKNREIDSENREMVLKKQLDKADAVIQALESEKKSFARKESAWNEERRDLERRQQLSQKDMKVLRGQENVYKREVESLRSIVKTFDELPLGQNQGTKAGTPANVCVLQVSLASAREQTNVLKTANENLQEDLNSVVAEKEDIQKRHNVVLEKFGKLKDALYSERSKAEKAIERANEAEILAGKGSFNPDRTRVLHMGTNPLTMALKEEISVLKKQVEVLTNGDSGKKNKSAYSTDVDPNKLHQRLKQSFKEQISRFREGVYLMTGYKVDMIPENERYKFKVRSVFAEREKDYLLFQWPEGNEVTSLDLLNTEYAKLLTKSPSYEYMTKFHSLPAFLASTQLNLFEKQTMM